MRTSLLLSLALMASQGSSSAQEVVWKGSYQDGLNAVKSENKPLAVFVGTGASSQQQIVLEGSFSTEIRKVLSQHYVSVFLDTSNPSHQRLVREFGVTSSGLILSDSTGGFQAYHHSGQLSQADLLARLNQHTGVRISYYPPVQATSFVPTAASDAPAPAQLTSSFGISHYQPAYSPPAYGYSGYSAPAYSAPVSRAPAMSFGGGRNC